MSKAERTRGTEGFRTRLVADLRPMRPYWPVRTRFALWLTLQVMVVAAVLGMGARPDLREQMGRWPFVVELALLAVSGIASVLVALRSAVPGQGPKRGVVYALMAVAVGAFALGVALLPWASLDWSLLDGRGCAGKTLMIAAMPWIALAVVVARGAAVDLLVTGVLVGLGPLVASAAIMRLMCPVEEGMHVLFWHDFPVLAGIALTLAVGVSVFNRWARRPLQRS